MLLHRVAAVVCVAGALGSAHGQSKLAEPMVTGFVTALAADGGFSVQGVPIVLTAKTKIFSVTGKNQTALDKVGDTYLGEEVAVWGRFEKKTKTISAEYIHVVPPATAKIAGKAMIDFVAVDTTATASGATAAAAADADRTVRADGYSLRLTAATKMHYNEPLASLKDVGTNQWITYTGVQGVDGVVLVDEAEVWQNRVDPDEAKLRKSKEFDPAAVKQTDHRKIALKHAFFGVNEKDFPPHADVDLQERVAKIGDSLVPAYQKALPATDATKINFRFQVVDADLQLNGWGLASGVVQVPFPAIMRLTTDSEIAAMLADHVATVIEKQALMNAPAKFRLATANWVSLPASIALGVLVPFPGVGLLTQLGTQGTTGKISSHIETLAEQQSGRVGLCLMKDAGYDVTAAPLTWWLLKPEKPKPVEAVEIPDRSSDLYQVLGTTWRGKTQ